jgi:two-component system chemotaxis sensor kinase CheA
MDDLIGEFITETTESIALLDSELVKLEQNPNDREILGNIFRLVHTIKGTCGFLGLPRLESVAHAGENVLGKIRDGEIIVTEEAISLVLAALDTIRGLVESLAENGVEPEGDDKPLIARLNAFADSNGASSVAVVSEKPDTKSEVAVANMLAPEEIKTGGGSYSKNELDALERAFNEASFEGAEDFSKAPEIDWDAINAEQGGPPAESESAEPALPAAAASPKKEPTDAAKQAAIKQGLEADTKEGGAAGGGGLGNQSIRVNLDVLENLMQMVGELVLTRNQLMQIVRNREDADLKAPLQTLSHITTELQEGVMKTRMQPIGNAWSKFPRLVRDLSHELGKKIDLQMRGEETELDRQLLEMIKDPLTHMVRNSCDHGLEMPADRKGAGKGETGTVSLSAYHQGGHIIIEIADDGRGLNVSRIKEKIVQNGLAEADEIAHMSDEQIMQFIFKPGFSTAEKVTSVSGRGVGMDVVRTNIEKIGGTIELSSVYGKGSTFSIKIPLTLAIVSVLIVDVSGQRFAIPQINVLELVKAGGEDNDYHIETLHATRVLRLRDKLLPLMNLRDMLEMPEMPPAEDQYEDEQYIVVVRVGSSEYGIIVDRIYDTEEIVVKPVSVLLKAIPLYSGNTILGDGSVILILDPNGLARAMGDIETGKAAEPQAVAKSGEAQIVTFLVFHAGGGAPKAVPLELVSRLEEIPVERIEHSGATQVVQYRGDLMRLKTLPETSVPTSGKCSVVVFTYDNQTIGLVVDQIVDIVEAPLSVKLSSEREEFVGSMVISGRATDIVDVGFMLKELMHAAMASVPENARMDGFRLLYVEDSLFFRNLTVPYLSSFGYDVTAAADPTEALTLLQHTKQPFDVIVTDIEMPVMDGIELARKIRGFSQYAHVPIFAFTSTINEQLQERGREVNLRAAVLKTNRDSLIEAISSVLNPMKKAA